MSNNITVEKNKIKFSTESDYNINRYSKLLLNLDVEHNIEINGKVFVVTCNNKDIKEIIEKKNEIINFDEKNIEALKAVIRGMFMGSGSINNPDNKYHLEIIFSLNENLKIADEILRKIGIQMKKIESKNKSGLYLKDGEEISNFLALLGANKAVLGFEDVRVKKQMRGKVNRLVNCETANLNKTINASIEQISAIRKLQENGQFNKLDDNLKEIAILRIENPDISLIELGKLLKEPIGKSGVNYRLKKIIELAGEN